MLIQGIQSQFLEEPEILNYGCYFLDLIKIGEIVTSKEYQKKDVLEVYYQMKKEGFILTDSFINDPQRILYYITGKAWDFDTTFNSSKQFSICKMVKPGYAHFVLVRPEQWDSLDPTRNAAKEYRPDSYRNFSIRS